MADILERSKGALKSFFGYDNFRTYGGEHLQENAVQAALSGESILTIFPTGGGKSITFQLPALMAWHESRLLTIVISPLLSLMKDQVDHLLSHHITEVAMINSLQSPIERANIIKRIEQGDVAILYVSPEQLRSATLFRILHKRAIARVVIDEAHCFSSWGHDFRVDYLYIGDFIRELESVKKLPHPIPVSCFTATAKKQVIDEIVNYFRDKNNLSMRVFKANSSRDNLHYYVKSCADENEKYVAIRELLAIDSRPTIIYVSRTKRAEEIAEKLTRDGFLSCAFHGRMNSDLKVANQNAFLGNEIRIMVATSAFGMGVDKKDIGLVIHHDISSSLEAYLQESGRAGRDATIQADCYLLYNQNDLDEHFSLFSRARISRDDINRVWGRISKVTQTRDEFVCSAYDLATQVGWYVHPGQRSEEIESRVRTCVAALEHREFLSRARDAPISLANSIKETNLDLVATRLSSAYELSEEERRIAYEIMKHLIRAHEEKNRKEITPENILAISRVDWLADHLAISKREIFVAINHLRELDILCDDQDATATILPNLTLAHLLAKLSRFHKLDNLLIAKLPSREGICLLKEINLSAINLDRCEVGIASIRKLLDVHAIRNEIRRRDRGDAQSVEIEILDSKEIIYSRLEKRHRLCEIIIREITKDIASKLPAKKESRVPFSVVKILKTCRDKAEEFQIRDGILQTDIEDSLLYLSEIGVVGLTGGFSVGYNRLRINRVNRDKNASFEDDDFHPFKLFYRQKNESVHIMGEYARLMIEAPEVATQYVRDYFELEHEEFVAKHFSSLRQNEICRGISVKKYDEIFGSVSASQQLVLANRESRAVVGVGSPGCGKTQLLLQKIASLILIDEIASSKILVMCGSRLAMTDFQSRLFSLLGSVSRGVEVATFRQYCRDIIGVFSKEEDLRDTDFIASALAMIESEETELHRITKSYLLIDDAQDMSDDDYKIVRALMKRNRDMKLFVVGDENQHIAMYRDSRSRNFRQIAMLANAKKYELLENFRHSRSIVSFANTFRDTFRDALSNSKSIASKKEEGRVVITEYASENIEESLVDQIISDELATRGTCAVLTQTNEEAAIITGILLARGQRSKLIQSDIHFRVSNLLEIRAFLSFAKGENFTRDEWQNAVARLREKYSRSVCLNVVVAILSNFRENHRDSEVISKRELESFLYEVDYDDYRDTRDKTIVVSTIHKAKGREFDSVYILLKNFDAEKESSRRLFFVGLTRAKRNLFIHTTSDFFATMKDKVSFYEKNLSRDLKMPNTLAFMLTHRDVNLGSFASAKKEILAMRSGDPIAIRDDEIFAIIGSREVKLGSFSQSFRSTLRNSRADGYHPKFAKISYILAWRGGRDSPEIAIPLLYLVISRNNTS